MPSLRVLNISFECPLPYAAGHSLSREEAAALNRLRTERVSDLARTAINRARASGQPDPTAASLSALATSFAFTEPSYAPPSDPQAQEATRIARGLARARLTSQGNGIGTDEPYDPAEFARLVADLVQSHAVQAEAERRVRATQAVAQAALLSSDLEDLL